MLYASRRKDSTPNGEPRKRNARRKVRRLGALADAQNLIGGTGIGKPRMIYENGQQYLDAPHKRVLLFGMSGTGKTHTASMLRGGGEWFHYSVDYRIGTRYMGELIADNFKRVAMQVPFLRELLLSDSVYIAPNLTFENLAPLSTYMGKPGDPAKGGIPFEEYLKRQRQHRKAEIAATLDAVPFIERAKEIYSYPHFLCDTSGSLCEVIDLDDDDDEVLTVLARHALPVQIKGTEADAEELARRFDRSPKPMYYPEKFLVANWRAYLAEHGMDERRADPDDFIRWGFRKLLTHRIPRYDEIAARWGVTVTAADIADAKTPAEFDATVARALDRAADRKRLA